ncbi:hypothetical protein ACHAWF_008350 [Thalassiosira exigua]
MLKRRGKEEEAASSSDGDEVKNYDDEGEKTAKLRVEAFRAMEICYKFLFASVLADLVVTAIDDDLISKLRPDVGSSILTWTDALDVVDSLNLFVFACGLRSISRSFARVGLGDVSERKLLQIDHHFLEMLRTKAITWGLMTLNFSFVAVAMAAALPTHAQGGPLHFLLDGVSSSRAALMAAGVLVVSRVGIRVYCERLAILEDSSDNKRISLHQQKSKSDVKFASSRELAYRAYLNQALCAGAFALTAVMELLRWIVDAESGIIGRILSISDVLAPFVMAMLLITLNKSFLRTAIVRLRDNEGNPLRDTAEYNELFIAQTSFYSKVGETMKEA